MAIAELHPDWGAPATQDGGSSGPLVNAAGTLAMIRNGDTPMARRTYQAICRHWRTCRDLPGLTEDARRAECLKRAFREVGIRVVGLPSNDDTRA